MSKIKFHDINAYKYMTSFEEDITVVSRVGEVMHWRTGPNKVIIILPYLEDGLVVDTVVMTGEDKRKIMNSENGGESVTHFEVKAVMEDERVLISFYVDPEDPITIETGIGDPLGTVPSSEREDTRVVLSE